MLFIVIRFLKYLNIIFYIPMISCATLDSAKLGENKPDDLLAEQKSIIINYLNKGLAGSAHRELRPLLKKYPENADLHNLMGLTQLALKQPDMALKHLEKAYALAPSISYGLNASSAYIQDHQFSQAVHYLMQLMKQPDFKNYPYPERLYHNLGLAYERLDNFKAAKKYYLKAEKENPNFYLSALALAELYERSNDLKNANFHYQEAMKICTTCYKPVYSLALIYAKTGKINISKKLMSQYIKQNQVSDYDRKQARQFLQLLTTNKKMMPSLQNQQNLSRDQTKSGSSQR